MITFHITADIKDDRQVLLSLPLEVPTGQVELVVSVETAGAVSPPDWFEVQLQRGDGAADGRRYRLRGSVVHYEQPTEPVAEDDSEALR